MQNKHCRIGVGQTSVPATVLLVDQSSPIFCRTQKRSPSIKFVSYFRHCNRFLSYSRSKSKVVRNLTKFSTYWPPKNLYISDHAHLMARHMAKFHEVTPFTPKTTSTSDPPLKNCKEDPSPH